MDRGAPETPARAAAKRRLRRRPRKATDSPPPVGEAERRLRAVVAYDGSSFSGFQRQRDDVSVQEILEAALEEATRLPVVVAGAGRTDAGVHADGQVVAFSSRTLLPATALRHICDHVLPADVKVLKVEDAPPGFNPQRDAVRKLYRYTVLAAPRASPRMRGVSWHVPEPLDDDAMRRGAAHLVGEHDFRAFRTDPGPTRRAESTVRTVDAVRVARAGDLVTIEAEGPGFLYMMVRNITAALVAVGRGERGPQWIAEALAARERRRLPSPAPAAGLTLVRVEYADGF